MKKTIYTMLALAAGMMTVVSCSSNDEEEAVASNKIIHMTLGVSTPSASTRTYVEDGTTFPSPTVSYGIIWSETDALGLFPTGYTSSTEFKWSSYVTEEGSEIKNRATFDGYTYAIADDEYYYAVYPYNSTFSMDASNNITINIPANQTAVLNSYDPSAAVMACKFKNSETAAVTLKQMCAFFRIYVDADCESVIVSAHTTGQAASDWKMAGTCTVTETNSGGIKIDGANATETQIKLTGFSAAGWYLIPFIPATAQPGLQMWVNYPTASGGSNQGAYKGISFNTAKNYEAACVYNLGSWTKEECATYNNSSN